MRFLGRKGSLYDILYMGIVMFVFCMLVLVGYALYSQFDDQVQAHGDIPANAKTASTAIKSHFPGVMDGVSIFLLGVMTIGVLAMAVLIRVHPIFILFFLIFLIFFVFFCGIWANVYYEMASNPELSAYASDLTNMHYIMTYLPFIIGIIGFLLAVVMFKSWQVSG